ncbi:hypothetical protein HK097_003244, partial [Rhizophlyctis rosea]
MESGDENDPLVPNSPTSQTSPRSRRRRPSRIQAVVFLLASCVLIVIIVSFLLLNRHWHPNDPNPTTRWRSTARARPISRADFEYGLQKCQAIKYDPPVSGDRRISNLRYELGNKDPHARPADATWIRNATLWDGISNEPQKLVDVVFLRGVIRLVGRNIKESDVSKLLEEILNPGKIITINAQGRYVTPGLVDQHSHAGLDSWPALRGAQDVNEMTDSPTVPMLRALDGFDPHDPAIGIINSGGVTTSLILPGSGNLMGGEAYVIKHRYMPNTTVQNMLLNTGMTKSDGKQWRWMKMACGENPFWYGRAKSQMPESRLGEGWLFRQRFEQARNLLREQDDWCLAADVVTQKVGDLRAHLFVDGRYPQDGEHESLVALLRGDVRLNVHCYETYDIELLIRTAKEFNFTITTFHHALEAWEIADVLARENISAAIFADNWGYKREAYGASTKAPSILSEAGVPVSLKSDHPVINSQHLMFEAAKAHYYGFPAHLAIKSVTSVPAERIGAGWRVGSVAVGYDADVVIWDRDPLTLAARPLRVWTDGHLTISRPWTGQPPTPVSAPKMQLLNNATCSDTAERYFVSNVGTLYADEGVVLHDVGILVEDGIVKCIESGKGCLAGAVEEYDLRGGNVMPGAVATGVRLGLSEISAEDSTKDGVAKGVEDGIGGVRGVDGLRVGSSKQLDAAWRGGVLSAVSPPNSNGWVKGQSVAFWVGATDYGNAVIQDVAALHIVLGDDAKDGKSEVNSISGQFGKLRKLLFEAVNGTSDNSWTQVALGKLPLVVQVHEANDISRLIHLKKQHTSKTSHPLHITILGGTESWVVASHIANASIPVILSPSRCTPSTWETRRCRVPGTSPSTIRILRDAGVKVALAIDEVGYARNLRWEAGGGR